MAKLVNEGENRLLNLILNQLAQDATWYLGLYEDSSEPGETATLAGLTEQAGGTGYARIALTLASFSIADDIATYAQQTFTASGGAWGNQYGYFIGTTSDNTGKLLFVEHFSDGPYNVNDGGQVKVTPKITCA